MIVYNEDDVMILSLVEIPHFTIGFINLGYFGISSNDAKNALMRVRNLSKYYIYGENF
jgi:hypothetical protein